MICAPLDPSSADARVLIAELGAALAAIGGDSGSGSFDTNDVREPGAVFLVARDGAGAGLGYEEVYLSTRRVNARAIWFYERNGDAPVDNYGRYAGRTVSICLGKYLNGMVSTWAHHTKP